jgi:glycosyltransferase involved in cell wall biosynthesis
MRVLVDGTMARGGGGHTYLVNILPRLAALAPGHQFKVLLRSERVAAALRPAANLEIDLLPEAGLAGRLRFAAREASRIARSWGADLFFSAGEVVPMGSPCPTIASFRNPNVFASLDQDWSLRDRLRLRMLRGLAQMAAGAADRILFVSDDSAAWIGDTLELAPRKRVVVHHGIDAEGWRAAPKRPVHPWPFILSLSSVYRYKNFVKLIEAYAQLAKRRRDIPDLVIIGDVQDREYARKMEAARAATGSLADHIHVLGEVPYADVPSWYASAELFVFPSYLETFGHPLLEAMASDVPVVAADIPVFREIGGDAAFYADPHSASGLAAAMEDALFVGLARDMLVKAGRERVREFSWERSAERLISLFSDVHARNQAVRSHERATRARRRRAGLYEAPTTANARARTALG